MVVCQSKRKLIRAPISVSGETKAQKERLGSEGPVMQSRPRGMIKAMETDGVEDREEGCDTLMPRAGLSPRQRHGVQAVDTKERHESLAKREWGAATFRSQEERP